MQTYTTAKTNTVYATLPGNQVAINVPVPMQRTQELNATSPLPAPKGV